MNTSVQGEPSSKRKMKTDRYSSDGSFFVKGAQNWWYFMPISVWQWAALMNDGLYNWCTRHGAWGSWISRLEHTAKLICFVRDGRREEERLLSFRQERSTWCQERRRCSSCCLCCNPTTPPPLHPIAMHSHPPSAASSPQTLEHTHH